MRTAKAIWELLRLEHGVMIALGILVGAVIAVPSLPPVLMFVLTFCIPVIADNGAISIRYRLV